MLNRFNPSELFNQLPFRSLKQSESNHSITSVQSDNNHTLLTVDTTDEQPSKSNDGSTNTLLSDCSRTPSNQSPVISPSSSTYQSPIIPPIASPATVVRSPSIENLDKQPSSTTASSYASTSTHLAATASSILSYVGSYWSPINLIQYNNTNNNNYINDQQPRAKDLLAYIARLQQCESIHQANYDKLLSLESKYKQLLIDDIQRWQRYYIDQLVQLANKLYGTWLQYLHELIELERSFLNNINKHIDSISVATKINKSDRTPLQLTSKQHERLKRALVYATNNTTTFKSSEEIESSFWPNTAHTKKQLCLSLYESAKLLELQYNNEQKRLLQQETYIQRKTSIRNIVMNGLQHAQVLKDDSLYYHIHDTQQQSAFTQRVLDERNSEGQLIRKSIDTFRVALPSNDSNAESTSIISFLDNFTVDMKRRYDLPGHALPALRLFVDRAIFPIIHDIVTVLESSDARQYNSQFATQLSCLQQHTISPASLGIDNKYLLQSDGINDGHLHYYGYDKPIELLSTMNESSTYVPTDVLRTITNVIRHTHISAARNAALLTGDEYSDTVEPAYIQADDLFPLIEYVVLNSTCHKLPFMLSHVQRFLPDTCTAFGPSGMALTIIDAAVRHLCQVDINVLIDPKYTPSSMSNAAITSKPALQHTSSTESQYNTRTYNIDELDNALQMLNIHVRDDGTVNVVWYEINV